MAEMLKEIWLCWQSSYCMRISLHVFLTAWLVLTELVFLQSDLLPFLSLKNSWIYYYYDLLISYCGTWHVRSLLESTSSGNSIKVWGNDLPSVSSGLMPHNSPTIFSISWKPPIKKWASQNSTICGRHKFRFLLLFLLPQTYAFHSITDSKDQQQILGCWLVSSWETHLFGSTKNQKEKVTNEIHCPTTVAFFLRS